MIETPVPQLIVPKEMIPTGQQLIADLRTQIRRQDLVLAGVDLARYDPATLTDADVKAIAAATKKRQMRAQKARTLQERVCLLSPSR